MRNLLFDINSLLLRLTGVVALLSIPFKHLPRAVDDLFPFYNAQASRYSSLLIGVIILYAASQLARKKRSAYYLSLFGLGLLTSLELLHFRNPIQLVLYSAVFVSILKDRRMYVVKSDPDSILRAGKTAAGIIVVVIVFASLIMSRTDAQAFGKDLSVGQSATIISRSLVSLPLPADIMVRAAGQRVVKLLNVAGISAALLVGVSLFQPLKLRRPAPRSARREAKRLTLLYSMSSEDSLKLWPEDKHYYFYQDSFVAYKVTNGIALVLDGVTGKAADAGRLRRAFLDYAHGNGWTVAIIHADRAEVGKWERYGLDSVFIGSEAAVETSEFISKTAKDKHFRYVRNKAEKDGLNFAIWSAPLQSEQIKQLRKVSDSWLAGGKREYGFIMGFFDTTYIGATDVGVLEQNGQVVAYANLLPGYVANIDSIDHMRSVPGLSQVAMHFLLMQLICTRAEIGTREFNLGLAPLSKLEDQNLENLSERLLSLIKLLGSRYYSFSGLEQFKGKFRPDWEARYIVYEGGLTRLPAVISALNSATAHNKSSQL